MLLPMKVAQGVADGSVRLAFRRWRKQDVQPGQVFTTSAGLVRVDAVSVVSTPRRSPTRRPGSPAGPPPTSCASRLAPEGVDVPRRAVVRRPGPAGRAPRRPPTSPARTSPSSTSGWSGWTGLPRTEPWTLHYLELIREHPQRRAPDLAELVGRETAPFKLDVRKLKNLGLTVSFPVGYEVSPRGLAYLSSTTRRR